MSCLGGIWEELCQYDSRNRLIGTCMHADCGEIVMDIGYYYQVLDTGILFEKGRKKGKRWKIGERKRLEEEISFWINLLEYISREENGIECSEKLFESLERLCKKYKFPNYEKILVKKHELVSSNCTFMRKKEDEIKIYSLIKHLLLDLQINVHDYKDKEMTYRILGVLHNLPKSMHGRNALNGNSDAISCNDALSYAQGYMDAKMKEKYNQYL